MTDPRQLAFVSRHFGDLQTIRFAPVPLTMLLLAAFRGFPHLNRTEAWIGLVSFLAAAAAFYVWSTRAIKRLYGSVQGGRNEAERMRLHPLIILLQLAFFIPLTWAYLFSRGSFSDIYLASTVVVYAMIKVLDPTNLASRRVAWAVGLAALLAGGAVLVRRDSGASIFALGGAVWLALSLYDFLLLRRIMDRPEALR